MKRTVLLILFSFSVISLKAQTNLDSLFAVWQDESQPDSNRAESFGLYIYYKYSTNDPDSAILLSNQLNDFSVKHNSNSGMRKAAYNIGISYYRKGQYAKALRYLRISEKITGKPHGGTLTLIGAIYAQVSDTAKVLEYFNKGLALERSQNSKIGIAGGLINIGLIYSQLGRLDTALTLISKGLKLSEEVGAMQFVANASVNIGQIYVTKEKINSALPFFEQAMAIYDSIGYRPGVALTQVYIGSIHANIGDNQDAAKKCLLGYNLAQESGAVLEQMMACECLYKTYKALGQGNKALEFHELMLAFKDSLEIEEADKKLQQMEFAKEMLADSIAQVETDRLVEEAHQEEVRQKNKTKNIAIGSGLFILLIAGGLYSRNRYIKKSKDIIEKEKDRSENLLLNILPAEIADELKIKGKADARDFDMVSILFTDFKEFTQTSEKLSAQELVAEINTCFEAFDAICGKYKVEKIKTIGDAYMAAGGLPVPTDDSVKNTIYAALEMQDFIAKRIIENQKLNKPAFEMRVGIHTGGVVAGIVGVKKFQYDIWGDTVNTASRIESEGEVGKLNISQSTYDLIKDDPHFTFESRGKIEAKGKGEIEMYFVSKT